MTKLWTVSFRSFLLAAVFGLVLGALPGNAQTLDSALAPNYLLTEGDALRAGSAVNVGHESGGRAKSISNSERVEWFVENTVGLRSLVAGAASAGLGIGLCGPHGNSGIGQDFARRYEMHLAETSTGNAIEATVGAIWREDPRYHRAPTESFGRRVRNVVRMTFVAYRSDGNAMPAYARYMGIAGSSLLANSWRVNSEARLQDSALRTLTGFLGRMGSNAFQEFWPNIKPKLFGGRPSQRAED